MTAAFRSPFRVVVAVMVALAAVVLPLTADSAMAHPLGNFTINRYARVEVYSDAIDVHYVVDMAEIPTFQAMGAIDANADGAVSEAELDAYAENSASAYLDGISLTFGGAVANLQVREHEARLLPGQGGLQTLFLAVVYRVPIEPGSTVALTFEDRNFSDRVGWKELVVRPSQGAIVSGADEFFVDDSNGLLTYPAESLTSAPNESRLTFSFEAGTGHTAPAFASVAVATEGRGSSGFAALIDKEASFGIVLLSLLAALGFGMLHALGPGHGKTVVAAYLVGSKGTVRHALALGATVTATHTSAVYLLGFIALAGSESFATEKVQIWLGVASGIMIILWGGSLFLARLLSLKRRTPDDELHRHGLFGAKHSHMPAAHNHAAEHEHDHQHAHGRPNEESGQARVTWRSVLTLGVIGGMLPCPSAVVVMLSAIALGKVAYGMLLIVAFSAGLAGVLMSIGVALVFGRRVSRDSRLARALHRPAVARLALAFPVFSALGVTLAGIGVTYIAMNQPGI